MPDTARMQTALVLTIGDLRRVSAECADDVEIDLDRSITGARLRWCRAIVSGRSFRVDVLEDLGDDRA